MSSKVSEAPRTDVRAWVVACAIFAVTLTVCASGSLMSLSTGLVDLAFMTLKRSASGQVVIVQIDARSVGEIGAWPWARKTYAKAIDILHDAGASTIALDVDLPPVATAPSSDALARAVIRAKGSVVFRPERAASVAGLDVLDTSLAARIAHVASAPPDAADIDFSIDPASVPRVSFLDVYDANFNFASLSGKQVVIGVTSPQLGDRVAVPGHGMLSRAEVNALMAESLLQNRRLSAWGVTGQALVAVLAVLFMWPARRSWSVGDLVVPSVAAIWGAVVLAALAFETAGVLIDPLPCAVVVAVTAAWVGVLELARRVVSLIRAKSGGSAWRALADLLDDERPDRIVVVRRDKNS